MSPFYFVPIKLASSSPAMAISTPDNTFFNFFQYILPIPAAADQQRDGIPAIRLPIYVVEFEDENIQI